MRVALLTSGPAAAAEKLLDPRGDLYEVVSVVQRRFRDRNLRERERHDLETADRLRALGAEYVFAAAYQYVLTEPMLDAFEGRIVVVHDGDLTLRDDSGQRRWLGPRAVLDAVIGGAASTRNSLYFATRDIGHGPLLLIGAPHDISPMVRQARAKGEYEAIRSYAQLHRWWMRQEWPALMERAIEMLSAGTRQTVGDTVWVDGAPGPCRMGEAPEACYEPERGIPPSCPFIRQ